MPRDIATGFRLTDDVVIQIPALRRPTLEQVQARLSKRMRIVEDDSTEEPVSLRIGTLLGEAEDSIDAETYWDRFQRLRSGGNLFGWQHRQWILANQHNEEAIPSVGDRMALQAAVAEFTVLFPGLILAGEDDSYLVVPFISGDGMHCFGSWASIEGGIGPFVRVAVSIP